MPCPYKLATIALATGASIFVGSHTSPFDGMSKRTVIAVLVALHAVVLVAFYPSLVGYKCPHDTDFESPS